MSTWYSKWDGMELHAFLENLADGNTCWIAKRLSGNDTGLTGGHQVGVYLPEVFIKKVFPEICRTDVKNPDLHIKNLFFVSHGQMAADLRAIYYNNKHTGNGTRNEFRMTRWGGRSSPVQSVENTGALMLFAVRNDPVSGLTALSWVCRSVDEETIVENWLGEEVFPGEYKTSFLVKLRAMPLLDRIWSKIPETWYAGFPSGGDVFRLIEQNISLSSQHDNIDQLLVKRREIEYLLYKKIEEKIVMPRITKGFVAIDDFINLANEITNRRKSRTGRSLELNLESIFKETHIAFESQVVTENNKKPDFVFPSGRAYRDTAFPAVRLHMLAAKTCCKDRWRQILNEANRIPKKHLFTLQEGVSENQLAEMETEGVKLVVPECNKSSFPKMWHSKLTGLGQFIAMRKATPNY